MREVKGFKNCWILLEEGLVKTSLLIENGLISKIGDIEEEDLIELEEDKIIIPGFIDQHIHGAGGSDIIDGTKDALHNMACHLAIEGTTAFLATTTTESVDVITNSLNAIKEYVEDNVEEGAEVIGVHLEGPFLARKYAGAQIPQYLLKPNVETFKKFEEASGGNIKLVTIAVEEEGADELVDYLISKGIVISIGHSNAGYEDILKAVKKGVRCVTHTYNAQRPLRRDEIGTVGSTFLFDELYSEAICDGSHSSIPAIRLLWKNKPKDKFILVTDALKPKYMPAGRYKEGNEVIISNGKDVRLETGRLAGSVLRMNQAVKNVMDFVGSDFITTVKCGTENPAKNLGVYDKMGSIKEGKYANLVVVDKDVNVYQTIRRGKEIYKR